MRTRHLVTLLSLAPALGLEPGAGALTAQTQPNIVWHKDNTLIGPSNSIPWGSDGCRYQVIVANAQFPKQPVVIRDVFVAVSSRSTHPDTEITYGDIEIRMGITQQLVPTNSWAVNNPNPTTVFRGPLRVAFRNGQWTGIGLPRPYPFVPLSAADNLCFEVIVWQVLDRGAGSQSQLNTDFYYPLAASNVARAYGYQWVQNGGHANPALPSTATIYGGKLGLLFDDGSVVVLGEKGCTSSAGTRPMIGVAAGTWPRQSMPFAIDLSGAAPFNPAFLCVGSNDRRMGPLPLPFDLGVMNAPGCLLWTDIIVTIPTTVLPDGTASAQISIPTFTVGRRFTGTWVCIDPAANPLGLVTSNYAKLLIGF